LERIIDIGFREPYVYQALADILQYDLGDKEAAVKALNEHLDMKEDSEIRARLEALREDLIDE